MKALCTILMCAFIFAFNTPAQRTTRRQLKTSATAITEKRQAAYDTVATATDSAMFAFSGYEKTLRSSTESFFVTNRSDSVVSHLSVMITYLDMKGRTLDSRTVESDIDLQPQTTRRIDIRSWDRQKVFYYHLSPVPRTATATPYRVDIRLIAAMRRK